MSKKRGARPLIIRYIRYGFFRHDTEKELSIVFENMLKALFRYPHVIKTFTSYDEFGKGSLRDEYHGAALYVFDRIIEYVEAETPGKDNNDDDDDD